MKIRELNRIAMTAALMAVCAWINIPGPVPYTLQTFALCMAAGLLGSKKSATSVLVYIAIGAVGLPVFSGGRSGIGMLLGETGGYIVGFLPMVWVLGKMYEKNAKSIPVHIGGMALSLCLCYLCGILWSVFVYMSKGTMASVYIMAAKYVLPFVIPDILKLLLADFMVRALKKRGI